VQELCNPWAPSPTSLLVDAGELPAQVIAQLRCCDCTGREDAKGAMKIAERQLQRIYR
jgi:hypothetical protein